MVRWQPGSADRLRAAALDLYRTHGFEQTTVADIAAAVGVSERTFFRHFADKREVLFQGQEDLKSMFVRGIHDAPADATPLQVTAFALARVATFFAQDRQPYSTLRREVIEANPSLVEREQFKAASLASGISAAFRERGMRDPAATLSAQAALAVFHVAFMMWTTPGEQRDYAQLVGVAIEELKSLTT